MSLDKRVSWIFDGKLTHVLPEGFRSESSEREFLGRHGGIRITESPDGVEFKWVLLSANWASLYYLQEILHLFEGPYTLRYFLSGWFTEKLQTSFEVQERIDQILAKSDAHVCRHTFVEEFDPAEAKVPHILRETLTDNIAIPELSVDCVFDEDTNSFIVQRVGSHSPIAQVYGMSPISTPCLAGNNYDEIVSKAYKEVMATEHVRYDHVLAAMRHPSSSIIWAQYQRVILPHRFPDGRHGVTIVTELSDVDIKVL